MYRKIREIKIREYILRDIRSIAMEKLSNSISNTNKSLYIDKMWHAVYPILRENYVIANKVGSIDIADAKKYKSDLEGLLIAKFNISKDYVLPTMLVNGYRNSQDYRGERLQFVFVDDRILGRYLNAFIRTEKIKNKSN